MTEPWQSKRGYDSRGRVGESMTESWLSRGEYNRTMAE